MEAVPELGGDRVLDRQRVDVARRQREDRGEDASNYLEEAPLRVGVDLVDSEIRQIPYTYLPDAGGICENTLKSRKAIFALVRIFY